MRPLAIFILTCAALRWGYAQVNSAETSSNLQTANQGLGLFKTFDNRSRQPDGSSRIFERHLPGGIVMNTGEIFQVSHMNYDGYADAIVVVYNKEERVVATEMVKAFYVVDLMDTLFFVRLLRKDNAMGYYQRLIAGDKLTLYKKVSISLETATSSGGYSPGKTQAEFTPKYVFYIQRHPMLPAEFKNKKNLLKLFPNEKDKLERYLEENKTDFKKDRDVAALTKYLDSILDEN